MAQVAIRNLKNQEVRAVDLPDTVYAAPLRRHLLYEAVHHFMAEQRAGTHSTKVRGEVAGSGRKLWRQKKTGRARIGSIRSPLWRSGGTVHGPKPRDYSYAFPRKMRAGALRSALSQRLREGGLLVVETLTLANHRTREFAAILAGLGLAETSVLVVDAADNRNLDLASRNLPGALFLPVTQVHAYDVLAHRVILMSEAAAGQLGERLS